MTIIHTVPDISNEASGPSYSVRRLCETLIEQGQDVTLVTLEPRGGAMAAPFLETFPSGIGPRRLGRSPAMKRWLLGEARSRRVTLLHNHSLWMMPNVYPGVVSRKYDIPLVVAPRGTFSAYAFNSGSVMKRAFWPLVQKPALLAATCFQATAEAEYEDIRRMGFRQPVAIIPNGVDIPPYERRSATGLRTLLYLGRLHPEKGVDVLLKAWQAVFPRFPDWQLRIVGPDIGGYLTKMESLAAKLGLRRVSFAGPIYGEAKNEAYRKAELYVLPSPSENFGVSVAESLAAGTPAIATKGAPWQGLEREKAGWWIDSNPCALAACLQQALTLSSDELAQMGMRGRRWMQEKYSWEEVASKTIAVYRWLLNGDHKPRCVRDA